MRWRQRVAVAVALQLAGADSHRSVCSCSYGSSWRERTVRSLLHAPFTIRAAQSIAHVLTHTNRSMPSQLRCAAPRKEKKRFDFSLSSGGAGLPGARALAREQVQAVAAGFENTGFQTARTCVLLRHGDSCFSQLRAAGAWHTWRAAHGPCVSALQPALQLNRGKLRRMFELE